MIADKIQVSRGDIVWVAFNNDYNGHIQGGTRPAIILQNNKGNHYSPTVIVSTITTKQKKSNMPTHVFASKQDTGLPSDSTIQLESIMVVNKSQIVQSVGKAKQALLDKVNNALRISLAI